MVSRDSRPGAARPTRAGVWRIVLRRALPFVAPVLLTLGL